MHHDSSPTHLALKRPVPKSAQGLPCLVNIYPCGPGLGRRYPLETDQVVIGRGFNCGIEADHPSVSRRHARIQFSRTGHIVSDLGSTNGTFVNDVPVEQTPLHDGDYLRVGSCLYRYLAGGNVEAEYHEQLYRLTIIDGLTGVPNQRCLLEFLDRELSRSARHGRPLALVLFDIDRFKAINDGHGHLRGDHVLRELARRVQAVVRTDELLARYGGEEFVVVLPEAALADAVGAAERFRVLVQDTPFIFAGQSLTVTISLGVAVTTGEEGLSALELIGRADKKLYQAKHDGRNRVCS
jgi:diguanylate cyclase (GGDEF)-like protein